MKSDGVCKDLANYSSLDHVTQPQETLHGILKINFDGVYESDLHTLRWLLMDNLSDDHIVVKLRSNLGSQIAFQLSNENLAPPEEVSGLENGNESGGKARFQQKESYAAPLFTVHMLKTASDSSDTTEDEFPERNHNQLFNNVNHITEIKLSPKESKKFVLSFLPNKNNKQIKRMSIANEALEQEASNMESYGFYEVNGLLFFLGYKMKSLDPASDLPYLQDLSKVDTVSMDNRAVSSTSHPPDYKLIARFRSRVCLSIMRVDIEGSEISFKFCAIGIPNHRDFTLINCSAIKLFWTLNAEDLFNRKKGGSVTFTDPDMGSAINFSPVMPYSHKKIRVTFIPTEVGEFNYEFQLENVANSNNFITVSINSVVSSDRFKEPVVISPDTTLDFGSCYTNKWTEREIILRSESELPVEVLFYSDMDDVKFRLRGEDLPIPGTLQDVVSQNKAAYPTESTRNLDLETSLYTYSFAPGSVYVESNVAHSNVNNTNASSESTISEYDSVDSEQQDQIKEVLDTYEQKGDLTALYDYTLSQTRHSLTPLEAVVYDNDGNVSASEEEERPEDEMEDEMEDDYRVLPRFAPNKQDLALKSTPPPPELSVLEEHGVVEEIALRPGTERVIEVLYKQKLDAKTHDFWGGHLIKRAFKISVHYSVAGTSTTRKKTIHCKALTCTSFIQLDPDSINFGDTYINTQKTKIVKVKNMSDLPAKFVCKHSSKVLYTHIGIHHIPPNGETTLKVQIEPRKANPDYRKPIKIINLHNKSDEQTLEVRSANIDMGYETLNSFFYHVTLPNPGNTIDFGISTFNSPSVRTFRLFNVSKSKISLSLSSSLPGEIGIYRVNNLSGDNCVNSSELTELRERTIEIIHPRSVLGGLANDKSLRNKLNPLQLSITPESPLSVPLKPVPNVPNRELSNAEGNSIPEIAPNNRTSQVVGPRGKEEREHVDFDCNVPRFTLRDLGRINFLDLAVSTAQRDNLIHNPNPDTDNTYKYPYPGVNVTHGPRFFHSRTLSKYADCLVSGNNSNYLKSLQNNASMNSEFPWSPQINFKDGVNNEKVKLYHDDVDKYLYGASLTPGKLSIQNVNGDPNVLAGKGSLPIGSLLSLLESVTGYYPKGFKNSEHRELYVRSYMCLRRELRYAIKYRRLMPVSTLELNSEEESQVVLIYTPKSNHNLVDKRGSMWIDAKVYIKLEHHDESVLNSRLQIPENIGTQIPLFKLSTKSVLCPSTMRVNQKNINFGYINRHEVYKKSIVILSYSNIPILYSLTKSGSIASGDIIFSEGGVGVISPFGKRRVEFTFNPTLPGNFHEIINVENVMNLNEVQRVSVKATVRENNDFFVSDTYIDFGSIHVGRSDDISRRYITISNASFKTAKSFEITVNPREADAEDFDIELVFEKIEPNSENFLSINAPLPEYMLSKEAEERIEVLEAKLEIAKRKCRNHVATKILKELQKLRSGVDFYRNDDNDDLSFFSQYNETANVSASVSTSVDARVEVPTEIMTNKNFDEKMVAASSSVHSSVGTNNPEIPGRDSFKSRPSFIKEGVFQATNVGILSYRRGCNKIYFTVASRVIQPLSIYLQLKLNNLRLLNGGSCSRDLDDYNHGSPSDYPQSLRGSKEIPVAGSFQIYEYKNRDVIKSVHYTAQFIFGSVTDPSNEECQLVNTAKQSKLPKDQRTKLPSLSSPDPSIQSTSITSLEVSSPISSSRGIPLCKTKNQYGPPILILPSHTPHTHTVDSYDCMVCRDLTNEKSLNSEDSVPRLRHEHIYLGNSTISSQRLCTTFLISQSSEKRVIKISLNIDKSDSYCVTGLEEHCDFIEGERNKIEFSFVPRAHGWHQIILTIDFPQTNYPQMNIAYIFYAVYPSYITFPTLSVRNSNLLDIGYCYVDSKLGSTRATKLPIENCTELDIYISAKSNLSQQCLIKLDENTSEQLNLVNIPPFSTIDVYIVLRPKLFTQHGKKDTSIVSSEDRNYRAAHIKNLSTSSDNLRKLTGGIKFMVHIPPDGYVTTERKEYDPSGMNTVSAKTLMFTATIGISTLKVSSNFINLGSVNVFQDLEGSFVVSNAEYRLPLSFRAICMSDNIQILPYRSEIPERSSYDDEECSETVKFKLRIGRYGFYSPKILIKNLNNPHQRLLIKVWAFADPGYISIYHEPLILPVKILCPENARKPLIQWNTAIITHISHIDDSKDASFKTYCFANGYKYYRNMVKVFEIENISRNDLNLRIKSDIKLWIGLQSQKDADSMSNQNYSHGQAHMPLFYHPNRAGPFFDNGYLFLRKNRKKTIRISIPQLLRNKENITAIHNHKIVEQFGVLVFENARNGKFLKTIFLHSTYCMPRIELDPKTINLGKVGYSNGWRDVHFSFAVTNISEVDLIFEFSLPSYFYVASTIEDGILTYEENNKQDPNTRKSTKKYRLKNLGRVDINCVLRLERGDCTKQVDRSVAIQVTNLRDHSNVNELSISYLVTTPGLEFHRLGPGGLVLNPLKHPYNPDVLPSDTWFAIINTSDAEPMFELMFDLSPEISGLIKLTLHSRQSGIPIAGVLKLAPNERIELRLIAQAIDGIRIPADVSYAHLTNPEGITYGKLRVLLRSPQHALAVQGPQDEIIPLCIEEIPINGVVIEGNTFKLSTDHLYLFNNTCSDNSDNDVAESTLHDSYPAIRHSASSKDSADNSAETSTESSHRDGPPAHIELTNDDPDSEAAGTLTSKRNQLVVTNLIKSIPLELRISVEYPIELSNPGKIISVSPIGDGDIIKVDPGESTLLTFSLLDKYIFGSSEDIKVHFTDCASLNQISQTLYISIGENYTSNLLGA